MKFLKAFLLPIFFAGHLALAGSPSGHHSSKEKLSLEKQGPSNNSLPASFSVDSLSASPPDLASDTAYNRDIIAKHKAFRVYADEDFQFKCLDRINAKRRLHESTRGLGVGYNFTKYTVDRAHSILRDIENKQEITKGRYALGESFFWYYDPNRYRSIDDAINTWYAEKRNYDYNRPSFSAKTGGFTQLVWKSSREVSCAKIEYETREHFKTLLVCNYYPAGNVQGEFPYNVMPLRRGGGGGHRPDQDDIDYPNRPSRPDRPDRPDRPSRPDNDRPSRPDWDRPDRPSRPDNDRPSRPDWDRPDRPDRPSRPDNDRPSRPDYDPRPPNRPERPDYDPRPPSRPDRPRPPYDEDRPSRPGGGGGSSGGGGYPTHPVVVTGAQTIVNSLDAPKKPGYQVVTPVIGSSQIPISVAASPVVAPAEPTPVHYAPAVIGPQSTGAGGESVVYEPVEALLILPQYSAAGNNGAPLTPTAV